MSKAWAWAPALRAPQQNRLYTVVLVDNRGTYRSVGIWAPTAELAREHAQAQFPLHHLSDEQPDLVGPARR
jgi:hypothetical protein